MRRTAMIILCTLAWLLIAHAAALAQGPEQGGSAPADTHSPYCRVGDVRWCATHQTWEWRWFWPVLVQQQWDCEAVCKVPLVDEAVPWDCFYDKGMGPVGEESQEYQRGTYDEMWFEYKDQPPPHHMVIDRYFWWQNHP